MEVRRVEVDDLDAVDTDKVRTSVLFVWRGLQNVVTVHLRAIGVNQSEAGPSCLTHSVEIEEALFDLVFCFVHGG